jgi:hypothetical protein
MNISQQLLEILACPACKGKIELADESLACTQCHRRYPIRDGIPIMLISEAIEPEQGQDRPQT